MTAFHRKAQLFLALWLPALLLLTGCPGEREIPPEYRNTTKRPTADAGRAPEPDALVTTAAPGDAGEGQTKTETAYRYEKQFPLEGSVRFKLTGVCRGCSAGGLVAEANVEGEVILITGEVEDCEGSCTKRLPASGTITVKRLPRKMYIVRSDLWVNDVLPLKLGPAKRSAWVVYLLKQDCKHGLESIRGNERGTKELTDATSKCLWSVSPNVRFHTISEMLTWENNESFVPDLIRALEDNKSAYLAARVLGRIEDPRAVEPLIKALSTEDESLRWDAARSLSFITGEDFGEDPARWSAWYSKQGTRPIKRRAKRRRRR